MTHRAQLLLLWSPRILGILVCLFLSLFALDAFQEAAGLIEALPGFALHLAPMLVLLAIVALSWRFEWVGGLGFTALAVAYAWIARDHPSWIAAISSPLLLVGLLFCWSWRHHAELHAGA